MPIISGSGSGTPSVAWTTWTPGYSGFSANPTSPQTSRYAVIGNVCIVIYSDSTTGTSNATTYTMTGLPKTPNITQSYPAFLDDAGTTLTTPGTASIASGTTVVTFNKTAAVSGGFTASGGKACLSMVLIYSF